MHLSDLPGLSREQEGVFDLSSNQAILIPADSTNDWIDDQLIVRPPLYSFHSHPSQAHLWRPPSGADLVSHLIKSYPNRILTTFVITEEGTYSVTNSKKDNAVWNFIYHSNPTIYQNLIENNWPPEIVGMAKAYQKQIDNIVMVAKAQTRSNHVPVSIGDKISGMRKACAEVYGTLGFDVKLIPWTRSS